MSTRHARVTAHGWLDWPTVQNHLAGAACAWADLDGYHVDDCPTTAPYASHLWAWQRDVLWRARIEAGRTLLTELALLDSHAGLTVTCHPGLPWPADYGAIGAQPPGVLADAYQLVELPGDPITGAGAVLFARRLPPAGEPGE